jgi:hypothetical protein
MSGFDEPWKQSWAREADKVKALTESLRYTVKERDTWRQRAEEAEECIVWVKCDDPEHERLAALATENQAMREGLERIAYLTLGDMEPVGVDLSDLDPAERASAAMERIARAALSLPPTPEAGT